MNCKLVDISFRNQSIQAVTQDGVVFVAMRPLVENIGIDWAGQQKKLDNQNNKFSCRHISTTGSDGKKYRMICIPLRKLNGWLFSVNPEKVRPDIRDDLIAYQEECFTTLYDYFNKGEAINPRKAVIPALRQPPKYRYIVSMTVEDFVTGQTETFRGGANTPDEIITGTANRFGMHIFDMMPVPINAF
jgi:hypothetical protein